MDEYKITHHWQYLLVVGNFNMNLENIIEIDILDFFKSGKFDYLKLGQTKEWILNNFPDPDDFGMGNSLMSSQIWCYGDIELHFNKEELFLIFCEKIKDLDSGKFIRLKKWILESPEDITLAFVIKQLNVQRIDYSKSTDRFYSEYVRLFIPSSNVELSFLANEQGESDDPNEYLLSSFSLIRK